MKKGDFGRPFLWARFQFSRKRGRVLQMAPLETLRNQPAREAVSFMKQIKYPEQGSVLH